MSELGDWWHGTELGDWWHGTLEEREKKRMKLLPAWAREPVGSDARKHLVERGRSQIFFHILQDLMSGAQSGLIEADVIKNALDHFDPEKHPEPGVDDELVSMLLLAMPRDQRAAAVKKLIDAVCTECGGIFNTVERHTNTPQCVCGDMSTLDDDDIVWERHEDPTE